MRGKLSDVVSLEGAAEFRAAVPHARFADVSGAGHMVAGDRNDLFTDAVIEFLRTRRPALSVITLPQALERADRAEVLDHGRGLRRAPASRKRATAAASRGSASKCML